MLEPNKSDNRVVRSICYVSRIAAVTADVAGIERHRTSAA
jgi:hypothetical protein